MPSPPDTPASNTRSRLPLWKRVVFSAAALFLCLAAIELVLFCLGVRPLLYEEDPYVGFSSSVPLFVEETSGREVQMVTSTSRLAWFNPQGFPVDKPDDAYRIFCLGGSTTYGRPYDDATSFAGWLRELLPVADASRRWEVINAGGISYASYRVARLMEELINYQPDLFIIYTGHNEFLERRTYGDPLESPPSLRDLGGSFSRLRSYSALRRLFRGGAGDRSAATQLPADVTTLLDQSVGPEAYRRNDRVARQVLAHFRFNLQRMVQIARSVGADVLLITPASNLKDISPFKSEHSAHLSLQEIADMRQLVQLSTDAVGREDWEAAHRHLAAALAIDTRYAQALFLYGRVLLELGRIQEAKDAFLRARDEDVCPLRAVSDAIDVVRSVAAEQSETMLVDFELQVESRAEHGIPGAAQFLDHVHPTVDGHRHLAVSILEAMSEAGLVRPQKSWGPAAIKQVAERIESRIDPRQQGIALRNLAKVLGWAGKLDEAGRLIEQAVALVPDDAETQFEAGVSAEDRNDLPAAEAHYRRARELAPDLAAVALNLGVVLARQDRLEEAQTELGRGLALDPTSPALLANLARVSAMQNDFEAAILLQQQALRYAPGGARPELQATLDAYHREARVAGPRESAP